MRYNNHLSIHQKKEPKIFITHFLRSGYFCCKNIYLLKRSHEQKLYDAKSIKDIPNTTNTKLPNYPKQTSKSLTLNTD